MSPPRVAVNFRFLFRPGPLLHHHQPAIPLRRTTPPTAACLNHVAPALSTGLGLPVSPCRGVALSLCLATFASSGVPVRVYLLTATLALFFAAAPPAFRLPGDREWALRAALRAAPPPTLSSPGDLLCSPRHDPQRCCGPGLPFHSVNTPNRIPSPAPPTTLSHHCCAPRRLDPAAQDGGVLVGQWVLPPREASQILKSLGTVPRRWGFGEENYYF